jgi:hypothetical protein
MSDSIKKNTKVAIMTEVTEGTWLTPASGTDFISPLSDGLELNPAKELLERGNINSSIGKTKPRSGMRSVSASISVEAKSHGTAGSAPQYGPLVKAAMGNSRQNTTVVTTKASGNTATVLQIEDADITKFAVGDSILVKQAGAYHVSPITSKSTGTGTATVTMLVAHPSGDCTDSVTVEKFTTYFTANSGHPSISISKYTEDAKLETAAGCKVASMALNNFTTGQLADFSFSLEGLSWDQSLAAPGYTASYDAALPPIVLSAVVYQDGVAVPINECTFSLENTLAFKTSTASANGKISSRVTARTVTGSINPYKASDSIAQFTKFKNDTSFSVFGYMAVPTSTAGEFEDVVAFYMPDCMITEYKESDQDGLLQESLSFSSNRGSAGTTEELYITTI